MSPRRKSHTAAFAFLLGILASPACGPGPAAPAEVAAPAPPPDPAAPAAARVRATQAEMTKAFGGRGTLVEILIRFPELQELAAWATMLGDPAFQDLWDRHLGAIEAWVAALASRPPDFVLEPAALEAELLLFDQAVLQAPHFVLAGSHYPETTDFRNILAAGVFDPTGLVTQLADLGLKVSEAAPKLAARAERYLAAIGKVGGSMAWVHPLLTFCFHLARGSDPDAAAIVALAGDPARAGSLEKVSRLRVLGVPVLIPPMISRVDCAVRHQVLELLVRDLAPGLKGMPDRIRVALWEKSMLAACKAGRHCEWDAGTGDLDSFDGLLDRVEAEDLALREQMRNAARACTGVVTWKLGAPASAALVGRVERLASAARLKAAAGS